MFTLNAALLDACVLAVVAQGDTYGYELTQKIKTVVEISESTLYPVLRRLQKENLLAIYDKAVSGRNRRYYTITEQGKERVRFYQQEWLAYKNKIDNILLGGMT